MRSEEIWWEHLGCSLKLLGRLTEQLEDRRSAVLFAGSFPWRNVFFRELAVRRNPFSANRSFARLPWEEGAAPGEWVMDQPDLCTTEARVAYWPTQPCGEYLAGLDGLTLHDCDVWVEGIHSQEDLTAWCEFVETYTTLRGNSRRRATFLLEYDGPERQLKGIDPVNFRLESHNCRVFCLEAASDLDNTTLMDYQAEIALSIGGSDPELCAALLQTGQALLLEPVKTAENVLKNFRRSTGESGPEMKRDQLESLVWKAGLVLLFPILEQYRMEFIRKYRSCLEPHLPRNVHSPEDLELGQIKYIIQNNNCNIPPMDYNKVIRYREVRNKLAHLSIVTLDEARFVLTSR